MRGLASPHPFLGATPLAVEARVVLASAVFSLVQFVVGDMEWFGFFWLLSGERGAGSAVFSLVFPLTQRRAEQVRIYLTILSQKYGVAVERFYCTFQGKRLEESLQLRHVGIQRDSRLVMQGRILGGRLQVLIGFVHIATEEGVGLRGRRVTGVANIVICLL